MILCGFGLVWFAFCKSRSHFFLHKFGNTPYGSIPLNLLIWMNRRKCPKFFCTWDYSNRSGVRVLLICFANELVLLEVVPCQMIKQRKVSLT